MENNRKLSASCVVIKDNKVLLVKQTYGAAKGKFLIPLGFSEEGELPQQTAEREVLEETGVSVRANELIVETTKEIVKSVLAGNKAMLRKSEFVNVRFDSSTWQLFI